MARGTLNAGKTAISTETFAQCWSLDATGNWQGFREDDNGDGSWDLVQSRSANPVNEITGITNSVGSADRAGAVHQYDDDGLNRQTQDRITTLGTGGDRAIRRISTTYEGRGMKSKIHRCNPTAGLIDSPHVFFAS